MEEVWKEARDYEGYYIVSSFGRIKSVERPPNYGQRRRRAVYLTPNKNKTGYLTVNLSSDGKKKKKLYLHRVIAMAFLPNQENKRTVNHKNNIKHDNRLENLEWATHSENNYHAQTIEGRKKHTKLVINLETGIYYDQVRTAAEAHGINTSTLFHKLKGRRTNNTPFIFA